MKDCQTKASVVQLTCCLVLAERDPLHQGIIVERAQLKQRDFSLDLTSRLGKSQVITNTTPLNQQVGTLHYQRWSSLAWDLLCLLSFLLFD